MRKHANYPLQICGRKITKCDFIEALRSKWIHFKSINMDRSERKSVSAEIHDLAYIKIIGLKNTHSFGFAVVFTVPGWGEHPAGVNFVPRLVYPIKTIMVFFHKARW